MAQKLALGAILRKKILESQFVKFLRSQIIAMILRRECFEFSEKWNGNFGRMDLLLMNCRADSMILLFSNFNLWRQKTIKKTAPQISGA